MKTARIHEINYRSRSAGPLDRTEIFFQGCDKQCPGCFSPETHDYAGGREVTVKELVELTVPREDTDGFPPRISICGGEPLDQAEFLIEYLIMLRLTSGPGLSVLLYTGYDFSEIQQGDTAKRSILPLVDMIVHGRYVESLKTLDRSIATDFIGSENQEIVFMFNGTPVFHFNAVTANLYNRVRGKAEQMESFAQLMSGIVWFPIDSEESI